MRQRTKNHRNQGSIEKKIRFFSKFLRHISRWVRFVKKTLSKNSHAWAPLRAPHRNLLRITTAYTVILIEMKGISKAARSPVVAGRLGIILYGRVPGYEIVMTLLSSPARWKNARKNSFGALCVLVFYPRTGGWDCMGWNIIYLTWNVSGDILFYICIRILDV